MRTSLRKLSGLSVILGLLGAPACATEPAPLDTALGNDRPLGGPPASCNVDGHSYAADESWVAADGCNVYVCGSDGRVQEALKLCPTTDDAGAGPTSAGGAPDDGRTAAAGSAP